MVCLTDGIKFSWPELIQWAFHFDNLASAGKTTDYSKILIVNTIDFITNNRQKIDLFNNDMPD